MSKIAIIAGTVCLFAGAKDTSAGDEKKPAISAKYTSVMGSDWQKTFALLAEGNDPTAQKLLTWIYTTETSMPADIKETMSFVRQSPDWPRLYKFREKIEQSITNSKLPPYTTVEWFSHHAPASTSGLTAYVDALLTIKSEAAAKKALADFWATADLDRGNTTMLAKRYQKLFASDAHRGRIDYLVWNKRYSEATDMLPLVDKNTQALIQTRIALARQSAQAEKLLAKLPKNLLEDQGLIYERLRWRRRRDLDKSAIELLDKTPLQPQRPDLWWEEAHILTRRKIEAKLYAEAYDLVKKVQPSGGVEYAQAKWLLGWLCLNHLHRPAEAYVHFNDFYQHVTSAISRARGAYWAARAAEKANNAVNARAWDRIGAKYISTFYGQLSHRKVYGGAIPRFPLDDAQASAWVKTAFDRNELAKAVRLLHHVKLNRLIDPFLAKLTGHAKTKQDYALIAKLAMEVERPYYAVQANKDLQQQQGEFLFHEGYPLTPVLAVPAEDKALVYAVIHRESMFDTAAVSPAGARGLMQLMPATAQYLSRRNGVRYTKRKLIDDPAYNISLGHQYLQHTLDQYGNFLPLALAAYNAGPTRVREWVKMFGDPRRENIDAIDWIEHIPNYETRNYVQRVLESYYIYQLRLSQTPTDPFAVKRN